MRTSFSVHSRVEILQQMASQELDLLVIGGGITGAGIALDASERGLNVGLLEMKDFASGTSSRSTKLIHGGLRYLKQGEVKLVKEVGRERAILYKNAPHLVFPAPMLLPIYKSGTFGYFGTSIGLYLYDLIAGVEKRERRKMLSRQQTIQQEPLLKSKGLKGSGLYYEYRTDDSRLTLDIMKTAWAKGARIANYAKVQEFIYRDDKVVGVRVEDQISEEVVDVFAKCIVNATGPWVDGVRELDGSLQGKRLFLTKGVHLVVDYEKLPVKQSAYFDTPDGRMVFVIPRGGSTYIGTTDTPYSSSIDEPLTTEEDRDYLLRAVQAMFPEMDIQPHDVVSHWAGLRPLIYEEGKGPSELSRKDEIIRSKSGLITIAGGKLTGFRKMAEKVVDLVADRLKETESRDFPTCTTDQVVISGGEFFGHTSYDECKGVMLEEGLRRNIEKQTVLEWIDLYGSNTLKIYERLDAMESNDRIPASERCLRAQLSYSIEEEMTVTAGDFLNLRTRWTYFNVQKLEKEWQTVLQIMQELLGWDDDEKGRQRQTALAEAELIDGFIKKSESKVV
jgi:glycerol-3-phosphate dehydrogenase